MVPLPEEDRLLVQRIAAGDEEAAGLLQAAYAPALGSAARNSGLAPEDAQDAVQEALVAAIQQIRTDRFRGDACIETWLQSILKHKVLDYWRGYFRRNTHTVSLDGLASAAAISLSHPPAVGGCRRFGRRD